MNSRLAKIAIPTALCALALSTQASRAWASTDIKNLVLRHNGSFTELVIPAPSRALCEHFTEDASGDRPFRIVLNLCDAKHLLAQQNFDHLPACVVHRLRTSQFTTSPQPVVRIVLDLAGNATYTVKPEENQLTISIADPDAAPFAAWQANASAPVMAVTVEKSAVVPAPATPPAPKNVAATKPTSNKETVAPKSVAPTASKTVAAAPTTSKTVASTAPTSKQPTSTKPAPESKQMAQASSTKNTVADSRHPAAKSTVPMPPPDPMTVVANPSPSPEVAGTKSTASQPQVSGTPKSADVGTAAKETVVGLNSTMPKNDKAGVATSEAQPIWANGTAMPADGSNPVPTKVNGSSQSGSYVAPPMPMVLSPEYMERPSSATTAPMEPPSAGSMNATPNVPVMGQTQDQSPEKPTGSPLWASTAANVETTQPQTGQAGTTKPEEALIDRLKNKFFSGRPAPRPYSTEEGDLQEQLRRLGAGMPVDSNIYGPPTPVMTYDRETLLERIRQATQNAALHGGDTLAANGPARVDVRYDDLGRRDPFAPLLKGLRSGFVSDDLPTVESLRMVGALRDDQEALALLEDMEGHSYIMRAGDQVAHGRVVSVGEQRVLFSVDEYGWTRTVALQLTPRGGDPTKTLGANATPEGTAPAKGE